MEILIGLALEMVCDGGSDNGSIQNYIDLGRSCRYRTIRNIHNQIFKSLVSTSIDGGNVNKLELISVLRQEMDLSKPNAAKIVDLFFDNMADVIARGDRLRSGDYAVFMSRSMKVMSAEIRRLGRSYQPSKKSCHFLKLVRN
jgi:integration host factor subunit beta